MTRTHRQQAAGAGCFAQKTLGRVQVVRCDCSSLEQVPTRTPLVISLYGPCFAILKVEPLSSGRDAFYLWMGDVRMNEHEVEIRSVAATAPPAAARLMRLGCGAAAIFFLFFLFSSFVCYCNSLLTKTTMLTASPPSGREKSEVLQVV